MMLKINVTEMMEEKNKKIKYFALFFLCFFSICCFLSLNRHSKAEVFNYHSEIWADRAGYYVYLPAFFIYDFQAKKLPSNIGTKTGNGFSIDTGNNKIFIKYTYGVALMQSPFFIATHLFAKKLGYPDDGFSLIYDKMIDIAGVFYMVMAFIFLYLFIIRYVAKKIAIIGLVGIFLGTNIFYYSIFETGMSHVYSFFLFSVFLYLSGFMFKPGQKGYLNIIFGLVIGLIIVVRPINIIFLPVFFIFNRPTFKEIKNLIKPILIITFSASVLIIPQLIYWKYLSGHYLMYSYPNEGFTNFFSPKILYLWFSTNNGLFPYNPLVIIILCGIFFIRKEYSQWTLFLCLYFVFISYLFSSWWTWSYGCGYGSRPFVEYYALFALPVCFFIQHIIANRFLLYIFGSLIILCIAWNLKLIFSYDGCWYGGEWDWPAFGKLLTGPTK